MSWRAADSDRTQSVTVTHGHTHVGDARLPVWVRYSASPSFLGFALDEAFVAEISQKAFNQADDFANRSTPIGAPTRPKQSAQEKGATTSFAASAYWKFESTPLQR